MSDFEGDVADVVGPDRVLPCGCRVINGVICFVVPAGVKFDFTNLYAGPGRIVCVDGPPPDWKPE